mmetsp:Transcript_38652/g.93650  ORF Transcript_38652/g.93650 Transcript_38652/m.93650 type:complete len:244 (-) Transcript_38652:171-902(-)
MTMSRTALHAVTLMLLFAPGTQAYVPSATNSALKRVPFFVNVKEGGSSSAASVAPVPPQTPPPAVAVMAETESPATTSQDTPMKAERQTPSSPPKKKAAPKKKVAHGSTGPFAPVVLMTKDVVGEKKLNSLRAKAIGLHSDVISSFVDTADSETGQKVLKILFNLADTDKNGAIDVDELAMAFQRLGFDHLKQKQIAGIFARADADKSGAIDLNEWKAEAPKTLRTNLIKLAKKNGGELGFLA